MKSGRWPMAMWPYESSPRGLHMDAPYDLTGEWTSEKRGRVATAP
jgi:hypothetical protein